MYPILAHGAPPGPGRLWEAWTFDDPGVLLCLGLSATLYVSGVRQIWRSAGRAGGIKPWEAAAFGAGWLVLAVALLSPLHAWGGALFSVHMVQHELLMLMAAPLIVLSRPMPAMMAALSRGTAHDLARLTRRVGRSGVGVFFASPFFAWAVHAAALWAWHIPLLFEATLKSDLVHTAQHLSFFGTALLFWWSAIHAGRAAGFGAAVLYMFTTAIHSGVLGALITLAQTLWYPAYRETAPLWGLSPLEDQQLGGLIMWVPAGLVYIVASLAFVAGWLRESERRAARWRTAGSSAL